MRSTSASARRVAAPVGVAVVPSPGPATDAIVSVPPFGVGLDVIERALIVFALQQSDGNRTRAARFLHLTRSALLYRMRKHGL